MYKNYALAILAAMTVVISLWMSHTSAVPLNGTEVAGNSSSLNTTSRNSNSSLQNSTAANSTTTCNATISNCTTQNSTVQGNGTVVHVQVNLTNICESNRTKSLLICNGTALNLTKHCEVAKTGNLPLVCRNGSVINSSSIATSNNTINSGNRTIENATYSVNATAATPSIQSSKCDCNKCIAG
ncbi:uncharacterized protein LOC111344707 [Stylophora pistillata]|uniref:uncharacterized protein LOC111344707 n=1 Tax=Stylophora pistillata TaxID=50429 RepID=UPI000C0528D5|nr:uncharacterized protein LOC111344707 [Stylophora pistillata]